ncbi:DUF2577 domain-containing protein [Pelosinus sp. IPA-1]|uniref:DUF2577 domain-containing protein n=1 Tax=Pelosinus sp. IPA-1 TaxID=3029569 RepID=UPI002436294B|nr:DUF2577 domain-containing protein [Pelosinus sp. IPA-1]GMB01079.1 hypothetical protein PIPA1_38780 [Pelosinus sp. IPA-1]
MRENPYNTILGIVKDTSINHNSPSIKIGKIITPPPEIQVSYNGIILDKKDVWISKYLLIGYERTAKGHIESATQNRAGGGGDAEYASHNHAIDNDYTDNIIYTDTLKAGDYVSIMPMVSEDNSSQQYIILDQIVHL